MRLVVLEHLLVRDFLLFFLDLLVEPANGKESLDEHHPLRVERAAQLTQFVVEVVLLVALYWARMVDNSLELK